MAFYVCVCVCVYVCICMYTYVFTGRRWTEVELEEEEEAAEEGKASEPGCSESLPPFRGRASTDGHLLSRPRRWRYPPPAPSSQQQYQHAGSSRADRRMSISMRGNNASCWTGCASPCGATMPAAKQGVHLHAGHITSCWIGCSCPCGAYHQLLNRVCISMRGISPAAEQGVHIHAGHITSCWTRWACPCGAMSPAAEQDEFNHVGHQCQLLNRACMSMRGSNASCWISVIVGLSTSQRSILVLI
jgi:hypothetical protein